MVLSKSQQIQIDKSEFCLLKLLKRFWQERERKARTTLLMAILEDHLAKFHKMTDAKEMWEAIKSKFGGNDEYKKMQKYLLKQQFESVSTEDANQKFLRVFESDVKGSTRSSSSTQNVAFISSDNSSSTNEVNTAFGVSTSSGHNSQKEGSSSYTDDCMYYFFANQSSGLQLDHENLKQVDEFDLEEIDLKWQVAMISTRLKKFYKKTGRKLHFDAKEPVGFDKRKTGHVEDDTEDYALMAFNSSNSGSDTEVISCSKVCEESYAKLKKLYDEQREQLGVASIEIQAYTLALKKVKAQLVCHQKNQLAYEEKIRFMKINLDDKTNVLIYHKKLLAEAKREKEELKTKLEIFQSSSKGLSKLLDSQMSANDKSGLGSSDIKDSHLNDIFAEVEGMHAVSPPMTGNYMPPKFNFGIDESNFTYGPKQYTTSESNAKTSDLDSCESSSSKETLETVPKLVEFKPKVINEPIV
nr:ribonuclease H-like domain-containing protein [Tanacetum cinerariifolium]